VTNAFGGRALPGPAGGASAFLPDPLAAIGVGVLLLRGREKRGGRRKVREREGKH